MGSQGFLPKQEQEKTESMAENFGWLFSGGLNLHLDFRLSRSGKVEWKILVLTVTELRGSMGYAVQISQS